ncbi:MAG: hypothetical protein HRU15_07965, partial [Planctomycetes bacterium]|nr:hypothetical protein [Planctomycetota bacterium]
MPVTDQDADDFLKRGAAIVDGIFDEDAISAAEQEMDAMYAADIENPTGIRQYVLGEGFEAILQNPNLEAAIKKILHTDRVHILASATLHTLPEAVTGEDVDNKA